jgi:hypothetical protein
MVFALTVMSCSKNVGASLAKEAIGLVGKKVPGKGYYQDRYGTNTYYSKDTNDFTAPRRSYIFLARIENNLIGETRVVIDSEDEAVSRKEHDEVIAYLAKNGWVYDCEIPVGFSLYTYHRNKKGDLFVMMGEYVVASNASGSVFIFSAKDPYEVW